MPKTKNSRKYNSNSLQKALDEARKCEGKIKVREIARKYGVPKSTLFFKLQNPDHKSTFGPSPYMSEQEENCLENWILELSKKGFPLKKEDLQSSVQKFLSDHPRPNPFKDNRPGEGWVRGFLKRHPTITQRTSEGVTLSSACVSETDIRKWFAEIRQYFEEKDLLEVLDDPRRVFNGDESGFQLCPKTGKVLAIKGMKNVYTVETSSSKDNMTVMFTFAAAGHCCPPMIIYNYQRIPQKVIESVPPEWGVGRSENGWMTSEVFFEYIANVFYPYLQKENIPLPVIYFLDGHKTHLTYEVSKLCSELQIEMVALYPNATRILQPADVAVFRPVKVAWKASAREWVCQNPGKIITKANFAEVLNVTLKKSVKAETLINGFKACGLVPFDPNAVDYTKCIPIKKQAATDGDLVSSPKNDDIITFSQFLDLIGPTKAAELQNIEDLDIIEDNLRIIYNIYHSFGPLKNPSVTETSGEHQTKSLASVTTESSLNDRCILSSKSPGERHLNDTTFIQKDDTSANILTLPLPQLKTESRPKSLIKIAQDVLLKNQSDFNSSSHSVKTASMDCSSKHLASNTQILASANAEDNIYDNEDVLIKSKDITHETNFDVTILQNNRHVKDPPVIHNNNISTGLFSNSLKQAEIQAKSKPTITILQDVLLTEQLHSNSDYSLCPITGLLTRTRFTSSPIVSETRNLEKTPVKSSIVLHQEKDVMSNPLPMPSEISPAFKVRKSDLGSYLTLPKTPERKGKRDVKRMPFAITSDKYKAMYKQQIEKKESDLLKKEERKKIREQNKIKKETCKEKKLKEKTKGKKKSEGKNDTNACKMCSKTTKTGNRVICDMCSSIFHPKCVPDKHKIHVPEDLDIDLFICHTCYKEDNENEDPNYSFDDDDFTINDYTLEENSEEVADQLYQEYLSAKKFL